MQITYEMMKKSVAAQPFGLEEPFVTGREEDVALFYNPLFTALEQEGICVSMGEDHCGSGYASYIDAFLHRSDGVGVSATEFPGYVTTTGIKLYVSRLAPIAAFEAAWEMKSTGFGGLTMEERNQRMEEILKNVPSPHFNQAPSDEWIDFVSVVKRVLHTHGVELISAAQLQEPAPPDLLIPTVFNGPYYVFDTLFYWMD